MSITLKQIQQRVGVPADGLWGPKTAQAIWQALGGQPGRTYALHHPEAFFAKVRRITGSLDQVQVDTINGLLKAASHWPIGFLAYGLATAWHEARLRPIEEIGKGRGKPYGTPGKYGQAPYGRGLVQLTWDRNYEWADRELGLNGSLLKNFGRALEPEIATQILVKGMEQGAFTGKRLADYMVDRGTHEAFKRARKIINGTDRDEMIATYADRFQEALDAGGWK
jgi:hypothetical protein